MSGVVKRPYNNARRQAQAHATRLRVIDAAKALFIEQGYPPTTLEAIADAADTSLPTVYRLFSSKQALLKAVLDVSFGGDDQDIAFGDRPEVQQARTEKDPRKLIQAFSHIMRDFMNRSSDILYVLATAAQVDVAASQLLDEIRSQRRTGQSRIVEALAGLDALDPDLDLTQAIDLTYATLSPEVHRILTLECHWTSDLYEQWVTRSLALLLRPQLRAATEPHPHQPTATLPDPRD